MTITDIPDVPLPAGAHTLSTWADWDHLYRVIWTEDRILDEGRAAVRGAAIQMPDGQVDDGTHQSDPPGVDIEFNGAVNLTTDEARRFAAMIIETADQLDGWLAR